MANTIRIEDGKYVCSDERVDKVWVTGNASMSADYMGISIHLLMKNGERWDGEIVTEISDDVNAIHEKMFSQVDEYLSTIKQ